ncbi:transposase DNA-binding-containing protein [Burkholderia ubonensis]|uniref:IS4/Tn5 family transposase DNA-binding protein n=1 Tax=Burkholderia ubonensis TaxID=101571 RepID=UPI000B4E2D96
MRERLALEAPYWTETEFTDLDLGDARLNKRARTLMERLAAKPTAGVPQACRGWGETMGAYRSARLPSRWARVTA